MTRQNPVISVIVRNVITNPVKIAQIVRAATMKAAVKIARKANAVILVTVAHAIMRHAQIARIAAAAAKAHVKIAQTTAMIASAMIVHARIAIIQKPNQF
jgi:hypothetical protein